jgi:hypothetical protein
MIPVMNDNIIKNLGVTAKNSNDVIIRQIITAANEATIITFLSFIQGGIKKLRY